MSVRRRGWEELVAAGLDAIRLEGASRFALGDLALEVAPRLESGPGRSAEAIHAAQRLREYAAAIDVSYPILLEYRRTSAAWPSGRRVAEASWTVHRVLEAHPKRFAILKKLVKDARAHGGRVTRNDAGRAVGRVIRATTSVTIPVHEYERRPPGTVPPSEMARSAERVLLRRMLASDRHCKEVLATLTVAELGALIEHCWGVLEGRQGERDERAVA